VSGSLQSKLRFFQPNGEPIYCSDDMFLFMFNISLPLVKQWHLLYLCDNNYKVISLPPVATCPTIVDFEALNYLGDSSNVIVIHFDVEAIDSQMFPLANVSNSRAVTFEQIKV
jgi:hypothetical protein